MEHRLARLGADEFRFVCPDCGRVQTASKFPPGAYIGEPMTPFFDEPP